MNSETDVARVLDAAVIDDSCTVCRLCSTEPLEGYIEDPVYGGFRESGATFRERALSAMRARHV